MESIEETPTEPRDYAVLSAAYSGFLGALVFAAWRRRAEVADPIRPAELPVIGAATFTLARTVAHEKVETWLREPFVHGDGTPHRRPRGRGLRYAVGELLTCTRCLGTWGALGLVGVRAVRPPAGRVLNTVLAAAALNDFLQAGFNYVCASANSAGEAPARVREVGGA